MSVSNVPEKRDWGDKEMADRDHSFSTYAKFSEKLTFLTP